MVKRGCKKAICSLVLIAFICIGRCSTQDLAPSIKNETDPDADCVALTSKPKPNIGFYAYKDKNSSETCVIAQFSAYLKIEQQRYVAFKNGIVNESISRCDKSNGQHQAKLVIDYDCGHQICFTIGSDEEQPTFIASLDGHYKIKDGSYLTFSNSTLGSIIHTSEQYHYYKCNAEQEILLDYNNQNLNGNQLFLSNFSFEAFRTVSDQQFHLRPEVCELDHVPTSWLVDLGIFVSMGAIIVLIVVACLIYYRRKMLSDESSYRPM